MMAMLNGYTELLIVRGNKETKNKHTFDFNN
jgi:hypothetical protein